VRVYTRVCWCRRIFTYNTYIQTYIQQTTYFSTHTATQQDPYSCVIDDTAQHTRQYIVYASYTTHNKDQHQPASEAARGLVPQSALGGRVEASTQGAAWPRGATARACPPPPRSATASRAAPPSRRAMNPPSHVLHRHELRVSPCVPVHVPHRHARPLLDAMMHLALRGCIGASATPPNAAPRCSPLRHTCHTSASGASPESARTSSPSAAAAGSNDAPRPARPHRRRRAGWPPAAARHRPSPDAHQVPKLRMHCLEHVKAEPARPLATGDSTPPCETMRCGVPGGACARVGGARRRSTTSEPVDAVKSAIRHLCTSRSAI